MSEHKYLEICNIHPNPPPASVSENVSNILKANGGELVLVLLSFVKSGLSDQVDLRYFVPVLDKLDKIISTSVKELPHSPSYSDENPLIIATLKYLAYTLKNSMFRRFFLSLESVGLMMTSMNEEIAHLASEILFYFAMPTLSVSSYSNDPGWRDNTEVPGNVASNVMVIFESLGFLSTSYGILDYLRGQEPLLCPSDELVFIFPASESRGSMWAEETTATIENTRVVIRLDTSQPPSQQYSSLRDAYPSLSPSQQLSVRYLVEAAHGLRCDIGARVRILALRLRCLYILLHSHLPMDTLQTYLASGSSIIKDLMVLADVSSSVLTELQLSESIYPLSSLALDCIIGLLEVSMHRRKFVLRESGIHQELGIIRSDATATVTQELPWFSVLLVACTVMSSPQRMSIAAAQSSDNAGIRFPNAIQRTNESYIAEYVEMAIELFSACLSVRDHRIVSESAAVGAIVGMIFSSLDKIARVLKETKEEEPPSVVYNIFPIVKALQCLETAVSCNGGSRESSFTENEGLAVLSQLFEIFTANPHPLLFKPNSVLNELLNSSISLLTVAIGTGRRRVLLATESGVQVLYQPQFVQLCRTILTRKPHQKPCIGLVQSLCELFTAAIDIEPQFLAHFLRSNIGDELLDVATSEYGGSNALIDVDSTVTAKNGYIFVDVLHLAQAMCITHDGREVVKSKMVLPKLIHATVHEHCLLPHADGSVAEALTSVGGELAQILKDNESLRPSVIEALRSCMLSACEEARIDDENIRLLSMQRIVNLSTIVEALNISRRSSTMTDMLRQFFHLDVVDSIIRTFRYTLPPSRQLFAQITSHHPSTHTLSFYGDFFAAKSLTALVKLSSTVEPQIVLPLLFAAVDNTLAHINVAKVLLATLQTSNDGLSSGAPSVDMVNSGNDSQDGSLKSNQKVAKAHRKTGIGTTHPAVHVVGVLDSIPNSRIYESAYKEQVSSLNRAKAVENAIGDFVRGVLTLEWQARMISQCFKPGRYQSHGADPQHIVSGRDVLQRLFVFHRSSLMEVCRVASAKWTAKPLAQSRSKPSGNFELTPLDHDDDDEHNSPSPNVYHLRIIIPTGAVVRDGFEIDNSRIVLLAPYGATVTAYERICTSEGVVRYRTAHGWLSEFQRDVKKDPIVAIMDTLLQGDGKVISTIPAQQTIPIKPPDTLRDGVSYALTRVHSALKVLASQLSQCLVPDSDERRVNGSHMSAIAPTIATSLAMITATFFENPGAEVWPGETVKRTESDEDLLREDLERARAEEKKRGRSGSDLGMPIATTETVCMDATTVNMYLGATAKFVQSMFDDRGGHSNTYIIKRMMAHGVIHSILNAFRFAVDTLIGSIQTAFPDGKVDKIRTLPSAGRCALHSLPHFHVLIVKVANYDHFRRSPVTQLMLSSGLDGTEGELDILFQKGLLKVAKAVLPIVESNCFSFFPTDLQTEWMQVLVTLVSSIKSIRIASSKRSRGDLFEGLRDRLAGANRQLENRSRSHSTRPAGSTQEDIVNVAMSMGFTRRDVIEAMAVTGENDLDPVVAHLLAHRDRYQRLVPEAASSSQAGSQGPSEALLLAIEMLSERNGESSNAAAAATSTSLPQATPLHGFPLGNSDSEEEDDDDDDDEANLALAIELSRIGNASSSETPSTGAMSTEEPPAQFSTPSPAQSQRQRLETATICRAFNAGNCRFGAMCRFRHMTPVNGSSTSVRPVAAATDPIDPVFAGEAETLLLAFGNCIIPYATAYWQHADFALEWSETAVQHGFARLCAFLIKIKSFYPSLDQTDILHDLVSRIKMGDTEGLHGALLFLLSLMRSHVNRQIMEHLFTQTLADDILFGLCGIIKDTCHKLSTASDIDTQTWPKWVPIALLICFDVLSSPLKSEAGSDDAWSDLMKGNTEIVSESKDDIALNESKTELTPFDTDGKGSGGSMGISMRGSLATEKSKGEVFHTLETMLQLAPTSQRSVAASTSTCVILDDNTCQALLLLLSSLLSSDEIANSFVKKGTLVTILNLQANLLPQHKTAIKIDLQAALSLITRRCLETKQMLKLCMKSEIKTIFRKYHESMRKVPMLDNPEQREVVLSEFLKRCSHLINRNLELFMSSIQAVLVFKQHVPTPEKLVQPIIVELKANEEADFGDSDSFPGQRILKTVSILVNHISASHSCPSLLFTSGNCLHAFADCALALKGIPQIIAKCHMDGSMQSELLIPYLLSHLLSQDTSPRNGLTTEENQKLVFDIQAVARLMATVSTHRGSPRRAVLDSLIDALKRACVRSSHPMASIKDESLRLRFLSRIGKMLTVVVTSNKIPKDTLSDSSPRYMNISVESLFYLTSAGTARLLSKALASISSFSSGTEGVFEALMTPLEMLTRTKFLQHWTQFQSKASLDGGKATAAEMEEACRLALAADPEARHHPDMTERFMALHELDRPIEAGGVGIDMYPGRIGESISDVHNDIEDEEDEEDDEEEEEEEDEEDDGGEAPYYADEGRNPDDDEDEEEDEEEPDDDDDDDDDDDAQLESFVATMERFGENRAEGARQQRILMEELHDLEEQIDGMHAEVVNPDSFDMTDPVQSAMGNAFADFFTPPEQIRRNPHASSRGMARDVDGDYDRGNTLFEFIRQTAGPSLQQFRTAPMRSMHDDPDGERHTSHEEVLLPGGVDQALQVNWTVGHPLLPIPADSMRRGENAIEREIPFGIVSGSGGGGFGFPGREGRRSDPGNDFLDSMLEEESGLMLQSFGRWAGDDSRSQRIRLERSVASSNLREGNTWGVPSVPRPLVAAGSSEGWTSGTPQNQSSDVLDALTSRLSALAELVLEPEIPVARVERPPEPAADILILDGGVDATHEEHVDGEELLPPADPIDSASISSPVSQDDGNVGTEDIVLTEEAVSDSATAVPESEDMTALPSDLQSTAAPVDETGRSVSEGDVVLDLDLAGGVEVGHEEATNEYHGSDPSDEEFEAQLAQMIEASRLDAVANEAVVRVEISNDTGDAVADNATANSEEHVVEDLNEGGPRGLVCPPGYDEEVFNSLPDFMQQEIIDTFQETTDQTTELLITAGYDLDTINALPENIRQEILDQVRRERDQQAASNFAIPADPSLAQDMDNSSFLTSLTPDLRAEVLLTSDPAFIATLTPELMAEAQLLRERAAHRWNQMDMAAAPESAVSARSRHRPSRVSEEAKDEAEQPVTEEPTPRHPGKMRLTNSDVQDVMVPPDLLAVLLRIFYNDKMPVPMRHILRIIQNLCTDAHMRDTLLQLIIALLSDAPRDMSIFREVSGGELELGDSFPPNGIIATSSCTPSLSLQDDQSSNLPLPIAVGKRLIATLINICATNECVTYDVLRVRNGEALLELCCVDEDEESSPDSAALPTRRCFLELLIRLLQVPAYTSTTPELLQLTKLISSLCEPLEILGEVDGADNVEITGDPKDEEDREVEGNHSWVRVPSVGLSRSTLRCLCDALLNEACTREVFDHVIATISRLAYVKYNRSILTEVVVEVLVDLSSVSHSRMEDILAHLQTAKACLDDVLSPETPGPRHVLSIPVGDVGSQDHARMLRALQTLQSLAVRTESELSEVAPVEELQKLWFITEQVLRRLGTYVDADGGLEGEADAAAGGQKRQNSVLSSVLSKLLPVIEGFFLVHAGDILRAKDKAISAPSSPTEEELPNTTASAGAASLNRVSSLGDGLQLTRQQSLPGAKYRTSAEYNRCNLSLAGDHLDDISRLSFRRTHSLVSSSSAEGISALAGMNLTRSERLLAFVHAHKNILNILLRAYPALLDDSLEAMIRISQLRSYLVFDVKRAYFFSQLKKKRQNARRERTIHLQVRRDNVFEDSFHQLRFRSPEEMRGRLVVNFHDEEGIDAGGLTREWYMVLSREIFNPNYCLFTGAADGVTFQPNPLSNINTNHLDYFKFVGRVIGKAVVDGYLLDGHFTRSFYKHVLGIPVEYSDIEGIDPEYYKSLSQILLYPLEDLGLDLTFSADVHTFGRHEVVDLIPNGRNVPVSDTNKMDYIRLISHHSMTSAIRSQIDCFLQGFHELVPAELVSIFSPTELELLISGLPDIDIDDLRMNTDYHQYRASEPYIVWFWDVLRGFTREERALFLQFITGTSKVPLDGFANLQGMRGAQKFSIHRAYGDSANLPTAHTCFNQLDLPEYATQEELRDKLLMAIKEGSEGFGFA